jgi:hypothetical protein
MDYVDYVSGRVQDPAVAQTIIQEIKAFQERYPKSFEVAFINNFYSLLPSFSSRTSLRLMFNYYGKDPDTAKFYVIPYHENASEKLRMQTVGEFIQEIDEVVDLLGVRDTVTQTNMHLDDVVKVMIELMGRGYKRYPDLAR